MKLKTQFRILICCILSMPALCMLATAIFFISRFKVTKMLDYSEIKNLYEIDISREDWNMVKKRVDTLPPNIEVAVAFHAKIIFSTCSDFPVGQDMTSDELYSIIMGSMNNYEYNILPIIEYTDFMKRKKNPEMEYTNRNGCIITKRHADVALRKHRFRYFFLTPVFCVITFCVALLLAIVFQISNNIFSSIILLQKSTEKIANGNLNVRLHPSHRSRKRNELTMLTENLETMQDALKDAEERRARFIMGITHDLKTPVALIKGYSEALQDGMIDDKGKIQEFLSIISGKAEQLDIMISDLLDYVKLSKTDWLQNLESMEIRPVLENISETFTSAATIFKRTMNISIKVPEHAAVKMDRNLTERLLYNVISNAFHYTQDEDVISLAAYESEGKIRIDISDTGIGMTKEEQDHMFDLFFRGNRNANKNSTGIGLSVVRTILQLYNWDVEVKSELNKGTTFSFMIPTDDKKCE